MLPVKNNTPPNYFFQLFNNKMLLTIFLKRPFRFKYSIFLRTQKQQQKISEKNDRRISVPENLHL